MYGILLAALLAGGAFILSQWKPDDAKAPPPAPPPPDAGGVDLGKAAGIVAGAAPVVAGAFEAIGGTAGLAAAAPVAGIAAAALAEGAGLAALGYTGALVGGDLDRALGGTGGGPTGTVARVGTATTFASGLALGGIGFIGFGLLGAGIYAIVSAIEDGKALAKGPDGAVSDYWEKWDAIESAAFVSFKLLNPLRLNGKEPMTDADIKLRSWAYADGYMREYNRLAFVQWQKRPWGFGQNYDSHMRYGWDRGHWAGNVDGAAPPQFRSQIHKVLMSLDEQYYRWYAAEDGSVELLAEDETIQRVTGQETVPVQWTERPLVRQGYLPNGYGHRLCQIQFHGDEFAARSLSNGDYDAGRVRKFAVNLSNITLIQVANGAKDLWVTWRVFDNFYSFQGMPAPIWQTGANLNAVTAAVYYDINWADWSRGISGLEPWYVQSNDLDGSPLWEKVPISFETRLLFAPYVWKRRAFDFAQCDEMRNVGRIRCNVDQYVTWMNEPRGIGQTSASHFMAGYQSGFFSGNHAGEGHLEIDGTVYDTKGNTWAA